MQRSVIAVTGAQCWGVLALPAVLLIILVVFLPNSPRWLAGKGASY
ncbi:MFS transporter [Escherichia coli]